MATCIASAIIAIDTQVWFSTICDAENRGDPVYEPFMCVTGLTMPMSLQQDEKWVHPDGPSRNHSRECR